MKINAKRSLDKRIRTDSYERPDGHHFSIAEITARGILITEFKVSGEVVNQVLKDTADSFGALSEYLKDRGELSMLDAPDYTQVRVNATCSKCSSEKIRREFDGRDTTTIEEIPVVPIFACENCGARFYSMSDHYLKNLVQNNTSLFSADELAERDLNENKFVDTLQEYIIRIFASKKIQRLKIKASS